MFGSDVLEIALGLVFIYLLMSLILTAVQESIENFLKTRAVNLERAIGELLQGEQDLINAFYRHPLICALYRGKYSPIADRRLGRGLPSYIPRETFAAVLLDLSNHVDENNKTALDTLMAGFGRIAQPGSERLRREIEGWFDGAMDRASGWYKRHTQIRLFLIALVVSLLLNVNSVTIANYLAVSPQQRDFVTALAGEAVKADPAGSDISEEERAVLAAELDRLGIPIGWKNAEWRSIWDSVPSFELRRATLADTIDGIFIIINISLGYLITAFALMLGAPFWFDVLNRIMVIRATVKPKEKSPDEPSEDGGTDQLKPKKKNGREAGGPKPVPQ